MDGSVFQYSWNDNELYLFRANIAYALRQYYGLQKQVIDFKSVPMKMRAFKFKFDTLQHSYDFVFLHF